MTQQNRFEKSVLKSHWQAQLKKLNQSSKGEMILYIVFWIMFAFIIIGLFASMLYLWGCLLLWVSNTLFDTALEYSWKNSYAAWVLVAVISAIFSKAR